MSPREGQSEEDPETRVLREYYSDEVFLSAEWILKVCSVLVSIASAALFLSGGCAGAGGGLAAGGATVALAGGAAAALLSAAAALQLPSKAPRAWLLADLIISSVTGVLLLVSAVLSMVFCQMSNVPGYLHGPLGITNALVVTASAVVAYTAVARRVDAARPALEPPRPPPLEHDV